MSDTAVDTAPRRRQVLVWIGGLALGAAALSAGLWFGSSRRKQAHAEAGSGPALLAMTFPTPDGGKRSLSEFRGQILIVNFWATWCPPCREEIPGLISIQKRFGANGVQIVGIAIDSAEKTRDYAADMGINYAVVMGGMETLDLVRILGNKAGALPFTVVLDRKGEVAITHLGLMSESQVEAAIRAASG